MGLYVIKEEPGVGQQRRACDDEALGAVWHCIGVRYERRHFINFRGVSKCRFTRVALMRLLAALGRRLFLSFFV